MRTIIYLLLTTSSVFALDYWSQYKENFLSNYKNFTIWTPPYKAAIVMDYVHENKPDVVVEIGSFQGAISFSIAHSLAFNQHGILHTIDTWDYFKNPIKKSDYNQFANYWYDLEVDGDLIYLDFVAKNFASQVKNYCNPLRVDSIKASQLFPYESIDMLFLDGDFSDSVCFNELIHYFPKVKRGGSIWINRSDLESKHEMLEYLYHRCNLSNRYSLGMECAVFIKKL